MSSNFEETSILVSTRSVPRRVLVVNDDSKLLDELTTRLTGLDASIARAGNGQEALTLLARQWYPLVITDDQMPVMDGIELTRRMRAMATKPTYVIMLTSMTDGAEMEMGYCAGVDHYLLQRNWQDALPQCVADGFAALRQRRGVVNKLAHDSVVTVDLQSGAHTPRHLIGRLNAEIMLAQSRNETVNMAVLGVHATHNSRGIREPVSQQQLSAVMAGLKSGIRPQLDWVAWLHQAGGTHRFLIVCPNLQDGMKALQQGILNTFVDVAIGRPPEMTFGTASFQVASDARPPTALELLGKAESARRAATKGPAASGVGTVQREQS